MIVELARMVFGADAFGLAAITGSFMSRSSSGRVPRVARFATPGNGSPE